MNTDNIINASIDIDGIVKPSSLSESDRLFNTYNNYYKNNISSDSEDYSPLISCSKSPLMSSSLNTITLNKINEKNITESKN